MSETPGFQPETPLGPPVAEPKPPGEPFSFHGDAREYFRVWIVNLALTLGTLGIYAAWAKVRRRRYFRGNIELMGHRFDYKARPERLLIGNLIVFVFLAAYALFGAVYPSVRVATVIVGILILPWVVVRSLAFNAHNTIYRGLRFRFHPSLSAATMAYILNFIPVILSLGICYPGWSRKKSRFTVSQHRFGNGYFRFDAPSGPFYGAYLPAGVVVVFTVFVMGIGIVLLRNWVGIATLSLIATFGVYLPVLYLARQYVHVLIFNAVWNGTRLDECRFEASMEVGRWMKMQLWNWVAMIATCGLLYPWATIRNARYTASCLRFHPNEEFYKLRAFGSTEGSAVGDTAAEFIGLDFGL